MYAKKHVSLVLVFFLIFSYLPMLPAQAASKPLVAVYNINAFKVDEDMVATLGDTLRNVILESGRFSVLTVEDMKQLLENFGKQTDCDTDECLASAARAMNASLIVSGSIGKMGSIYVINLRVVDAQTARTLNTVTINAPADEEQLIAITRQAGIDLIKPLKDETKAVALAPVAAVVVSKTAVAETGRPRVVLITPKKASPENTTAQPQSPAQKNDVPKAPEAAEKTTTRQQPQAEEVVNSEPETPPAEQAAEQVQTVTGEQPTTPVADIMIEQEPGTEPALTEQAPTSARSYQKIIGWSGVALAVGGAAIGMSKMSECNGLYLQAYNKDADAEDAVLDSDASDLEDEADAYEVKAKAAEGSARIGFVLAAVGTAAAVYYLYLPWKKKDALPAANEAKVILPSIELRPNNLTLSWKF